MTEQAARSGTAVAIASSGRSIATPGRPRLSAYVVIGGVCGLAWACGLRGFMAQVAGADSEVQWVGTFAWILGPGVATGALLGAAEYIRRTGGRRHWRWLAASPLTFAALMVNDPRNLGTFFTSGIGGAAIGVPLAAMAGGYALSGRGRRWARILLALVPLSVVPAWALTAVSTGGTDLALTTPRGAWVALYFWSHLATLAFASAIPQFPVVEQGSQPG